jgi:hypothetical protein
MTPKRFNTKFDRWLPFLLAVVMAFEVIRMNIAAMRAIEPEQAVFLIVTALGIIALAGSMLTGTRYAVFGRDPGSVRR